MLECPACPKTFETGQQVAVHHYSAHQRPVTEIEHGTASGYQKHRRRAEQPCAECKQAWREYYEKKRLKS